MREGGWSSECNMRGGGRGDVQDDRVSRVYMREGGVHI